MNIIPAFQVGNKILPLPFHEVDSNKELFKQLLINGIQNDTFDSYENTPMIRAVMKNDIGAIKRLIKQGEDINESDENGSTPLLVASDYGYQKIIKYLIEECNVDIDKVDNDGDNPLMVASFKGHLNIVRYFVEECKMDINHRNNDGETPLIQASAQGNLEVVKYLVEHGAKVNDRINYGHTTLMGASICGHLEVVKYLVENKIEKADINLVSNDGSTAMIGASIRGHSEIVKYLTEHGANVNKGDINGFTPLIRAAGSGMMEVIKFLVEKGNVNIDQQDKRGFTALILASAFGHIDVVKYLVEKKADINITERRGLTSIDVADMFGQKNIVKYLKDILRKKAEIRAYVIKQQKKASMKKIRKEQPKSSLNKIKQKPSLIPDKDKIIDDYEKDLLLLFRKIENRDIDQMKEILEKKPDLLNKNDKDGYTPLMIASIEGDINAVKYLIENNAKLISRDKNENTPLIHAAKKGKKNIIDAILDGLKSFFNDIMETNKDKNKLKSFLERQILNSNENNESALTFVIKNNYQNILELFSPYLSSETKSNAILTAIEYDYWNLVEVIINNKSGGEDINIKNIKDDKGNTLLILAADNGNYELVKKMIDQRKININAKNTEGYTALMRAVSGEYVDIVDLLLKQENIKLSIKNIYGRTVFDIVNVCTNNEILTLLEPYRTEKAKDGKQSENIIKEQSSYYPIEFWKSGLDNMEKRDFPEAVNKKIQKILYSLRVDPSSVIYEAFQGNFRKINWGSYQVKAYSAKTSKKGRLSFALLTHKKTKNIKVLVIEASDEHYAFMKLFNNLKDFLNKNKDNFVSFIPEKSK